MITNLLSLLQLTDPSLPIGSFSHSSGLETYVQKGLVNNAETARAFITHMLSRNLVFNDGAFLSLACDACEQNDFDAIIELDAECAAVKLATEIRQASQKLGNRLLKLFNGLQSSAFTQRYASAITNSEAVGNYSLVFGVLASAMGLAKTAALTGFYYNAAAGFVTNAVKLIPLGQQSGQEILFSLQTLISELVDASLRPDRSMIGYSCPGFDIRSMQHETLYSRLYMS